MGPFDGGGLDGGELGSNVVALRVRFPTLHPVSEPGNEDKDVPISVEREHPGIGRCSFRE